MSTFVEQKDGGKAGCVRAFFRRVALKAGCFQQPAVASSGSSSEPNSKVNTRPLPPATETVVSQGKETSQDGFVTVQRVPWTHPAAIFYAASMAEYTATPVQDLIRTLSGASLPQQPPPAEHDLANGSFSYSYTERDLLLKQASIEASKRLEQKLAQLGARVPESDLEKRLAQFEALSLSLLDVKMRTAVATTATTTASTSTSATSNHDSCGCIDDYDNNVSSSSCSSNTEDASCDVTCTTASASACASAFASASATASASACTTASASASACASATASPSACTTASASACASASVSACASASASACASGSASAGASASATSTCTVALSSLKAAIQSLTFDPTKPDNGYAELLNHHSFPGNESVWLVPLRDPLSSGDKAQCMRVIVKVVPYHSPERAQQIEEAGGWFQFVSSSSGKLMEAGIPPEVIRSQESARYEADMATRVNAAAYADAASGGDIFVPPLLLLTQRCPLECADTSGGHDMQQLLVFPYHSAGDAVAYLQDLVYDLREDITRPAEDAADTISQSLLHLYRDQFTHVGTVHRLGYVLCDHKLNNMVYDQQAGCFKLIDAEALDVCPLGFQREGGSRHTLGYAPPEQKEQRWVDSCCDVYACGQSIIWALEVVRGCLQAMLGETPEAYSRVWSLVLNRMYPMMVLAKRCIQDDPKARPTAEEALCVVLAQ